MKNFYDKLMGAAGGTKVLEYEPMKKHTTFRVGGPARYFLSPADEEALISTVALCREQEIPYYILGNGSNLLVSDKGYEGVMIFVGEGLSTINVEGESITAGAGALLSVIAKEALKRSLTGFEFAAGIPGTLGGAVVMNAGAYGGEMRQVIKSVRAVDKAGRIWELEASDLELSYRHSCIPERELILLSAVLSFSTGDKDSILAKMEELSASRKEKQPLKYPSAGSTFKRPEGYFAGKLIQDAGLKGFRLGGAQISEKHSGFVINREQATALDILELCHFVQKKVKQEFGVDLETEIKMIGF